eukprot:504781_1
MYLPMTNKVINKMKHEFKLSNAIVLCHISWQSYMSPQKLTESKWVIINLEYYDLELIKFVTNKKHDTQIVISIANNNIHKKFKKQRNEMNNNNNIKKQKKNYYYYQNIKIIIFINININKH